MELGGTSRGTRRRNVNETSTRAIGTSSQENAGESDGLVAGAGRSSTR